MLFSARLLLAAVLVSAVLGAAGACSAGGSGDGKRSSSGGGGGGVGGAGFDAGGCPPECSADLKSVVDCHGKVLEVCKDGEACGGGKCGDPCQAAVAEKSSVGCDYWAVHTDLLANGEADGACFAAFVVNTWPTPVHIEVDRGGATLPVEAFTRIPKGQGKNITYEPYSAADGLASGEVAILFLTRDPGTQLIPCPVPAAIEGSLAFVKGTGRGEAFHIRTDAPVSAYQILPYGGGDSHVTAATLLLPTSSWDDNYVLVNAYRQSEIPEVLAAGAHPSLAVLAQEDGTEVTISPVAAIEAGAGVSGTAAGTPITYTLARGEYVQFTQVAELTGSPLQANKPVAVFGASTCMNVTSKRKACDSGMQQVPPVRALGSEYVAVRHRARTGNYAQPFENEAPPWRIVGAVDGTQLTYEPSKPPGAPTVVDLGTVAEFLHPGPFVVRSQDAGHPFYLGAHMLSSDADNGGDPTFSGEGDPEWVNVIPTGQYLNRYIFFTDPTYPETSLVVVRAQKDGAFGDVQLACAGTLDGWQAVGAYEYTRVSLVTGNFEGVGGCQNGRQEMTSTHPFAVTVWGWGTSVTFLTDFFNSLYTSYAYPAGAGTQAINDVVVVPSPK